MCCLGYICLCPLVGSAWCLYPSNVDHFGPSWWNNTTRGPKWCHISTLICQVSMDCPIRSKQQIALLGTQPMAASMAKSCMGPQHPPNPHFHPFKLALLSLHKRPPQSPPFWTQHHPFCCISHLPLNCGPEAMAALAPSKMLGTRLNFAGSSRYATAAPTTGAQKIVSLFSKKPAPKPKPAAVTSSSPDIGDELAKWYGEWNC